jgi:hypothetical protein
MVVHDHLGQFSCLDTVNKFLKLFNNNPRLKTVAFSSFQFQKINGFDNHEIHVDLPVHGSEQNFRQFVGFLFEGEDNRVFLPVTSTSPARSCDVDDLGTGDNNSGSLRFRYGRV